MNLHVAQNLFHQSLQNYFYGVFNSRATNYFYPIVHSLSSERVKKSIGDQVKHLAIIGDIEVATNDYSVAELFCRMYQQLKSICHDKDVEKSHNVTIRNSYKTTNYRRNCKSRILHNLIEYLRRNTIEDYVDTLLIHGSFSTRDYVPGVSDLDMLIIINEDTMSHPSKLQRLHKICYRSLHYFYQIDPLQHHGYFILTPFDLSYFPQTFFPTLLFDFSTLVFGNASFCVSLRPCDSEKENILRSTLDYLGGTNPGKIKHVHAYKMYFNVLQLLPIAYFQYIGKAMYKKYSFNPFVALFPQSFEIFSECRRLRLNWQVPHLQRNYLEDVLFRIFSNPKIRMLLNNKMYIDVPEYMYKIVGTKLYESHIRPLVKHMESELNAIH